MFGASIERFGTSIENSKCCNCHRADCLCDCHVLEAKYTRIKNLYAKKHPANPNSLDTVIQISTLKPNEQMSP